MADLGSTPGRDPAVLLFSMPWASVAAPALGVAILKAKLLENGIPCRVAHMHLFLLQHMDAAEYMHVADLFGFNEFVFSKTLEENVSADQRCALRQMVEGNDSLETHVSRRFLNASTADEYASRLRDKVVPEFLKECMRVVDETPATLIGFTCQFDQIVASLALASLIKKKYPEKTIAMGGYALQAPVGALILKCFSFIDTIVQGDGEDAIVALARASAGQVEVRPQSLFPIKSPARNVREPLIGQVVNLDDSPMPDYSDWFLDMARLESKHHVKLDDYVLPLESSRGCWWGQVAHCVFCGIDDETLRYRAKSPELVKSMLAEMRRRHGDRDFHFSDYILPQTYYKTLLPDLAKEENKYSLYWQIKSNIKLEDVRLMREAGVSWVTVGIESFSSSLLKKIDKGVTGIQNVLCIKLLTEHRIDAVYNILYGFPHEDESDYESMTTAIPAIYHLIAPGVCMPVLTVRYSPLHENPQRFGIDSPMEAMDRYRMIFSEEYRREVGFDLNQYGYTFKTPYPLKPELKPYYDILRVQVGHWQDAWTRCAARLSYGIHEDGIEFRDSRFSQADRTFKFGRGHSLVYETIAQRILTRKEIAARLAWPVSPSQVNEILAELADQRLIYQEGEKFLGLALPAAYHSAWDGTPITARNEFAASC